MAIFNDGGGGVRSTATTTPDGAATKSKPPAAATPVPALRLAPAPAAPSASRPAPATKFDRASRAGDEARPSITAAVRGTATPQRPAAASDTRPRGVDASDRHMARKAATERAAAASRIEDESTARRGAKSSNDGQADRGLRSGGHVGERDRRIAELKARQAELQAERDRTAAEVKALDREISRETKVAGIVGAAAKVVMPGVSLVGGLFGTKDPVKAAAEKLLDTGDDRSRLADRQRRLGAQEARTAEELQRLQDERVLNFLADTAHVTNMPSAVAQVLEGTAGPKINVVGSTGLGSDAAYSSSDQSIIVDRKVAQKVRADLDQLRRSGVVDEDGNILDAKKFDRSKAGDSAISSAVLIGVHEVTHGSQDARGKIDAVAKESQAPKPNQHSHGGHAHSHDHDKPAQRSGDDVERRRVDALEYDAYVNQETIELQAGKEKQGFVTINPDGSLLPRAQAVDNIVNFQLGLPLVHGATAGRTFTGVVAGSEDDTPGKYSPGKYSPGDDIPGKYSPGTYSPGKYSPGDDTPGKYSPGKYSPGDDIPGKYSPGTYSPGKYSPGDDTPGKYSPGKYSPGDDTPGKYSPGKYSPGKYSPGFATG